MTEIINGSTAKKSEFIYLSLLLFFCLHVSFVCGVYLGITRAMWSTIFFNFIIYHAAQFGLTAGAHRLWSHRAYKAKLPLEILLLFCFTLSLQNSVIHWVRDHRVHHKYSDTNADPHNSRRGFFFCHIGWLLVTKHPDVGKKGKTIDFSDLYNNPLLTFQKKYALLLFIIFVGILPTVIPMYFWGESLACAWNLAITRIVFNLHVTFLVNSAAHYWGYKPYDKTLLPAENVTVALLTLGEGFHNYHHAFPMDYRAAELGNNKWNVTTKLIDFFARIGWAYDLKTTSEEIITARIIRTGDGTDFRGKPLEFDKDNM